MKLKYIYFFVLCILSGCNTDEKATKDIYEATEKDIDLTMWIWNNQNSFFFTLEHGKNKISIRKFNHGNLINDSECILTESEIRMFKKTIKEYCTLEEEYFTQCFPYDEKFEINFIMMCDDDKIQSTYRGMKVKDLSNELKSILQSMKSKNQIIKRILDEEIE